jgi:hypothetical protein
MHCLPIPDDAFAALKLPPERAEEELGLYRGQTTIYLDFNHDLAKMIERTQIGVAEEQSVYRYRRHSLPRLRGWSVLPVDLAAMTDRQRQHAAAVILDLADQTVVTDAIAPESRPIASQGVADAPGVVPGGQALDHEPLDAVAGYRVQASELVLDLTGQVNAPGHCAKTHRG